MGPPADRSETGALIGWVLFLLFFLTVSCFCRTFRRHICCDCFTADRETSRDDMHEMQIRSHPTSTQRTRSNRCFLRPFWMVLSFLGDRVLHLLMESLWFAIQMMKLAWVSKMYRHDLSKSCEFNLRMYDQTFVSIRETIFPFRRKKSSNDSTGRDVFFTFER